MADGQAHVSQQQSLGDLHAPEATYQIKKAPAKKRGAVIGSAPKLNSEGLLAAARAAKEKEERQKAQVGGDFFLTQPVHQRSALTSEYWHLPRVCKDCLYLYKTQSSTSEGHHALWPQFFQRPQKPSIITTGQALKGCIFSCQEAKEKANAAAAAKRVQQQRQPQGVAQQQQPPPQGSQGATAASAQPLLQGPVRGVIHSSGRWNKQT
jgi:hypothetical protein